MSITPESIQQLLSSENYSDRIRGINQLRQIDSEIAFEMIQPLVKDSNVRIRYAAVSQFDTLGKHDLKTSLEILRDRLYNDAEIDVKAAAADAMAALKIPEAYEDLDRIYHQNSDWLLQLSIIAALGEFGDPRGFDLLEEALTSDNDLLVTAAISSFGELGDSRAVPLLIPFAANEDWQIRHRLAQALGRLASSETRPVLEQLTRDTVEVVAKEATNSLSQ